VAIVAATSRQVRATDIDHLVAFGQLAVDLVRRRASLSSVCQADIPGTPPGGPRTFFGMALLGTLGSPNENRPEDPGLGADHPDSVVSTVTGRASRMPTNSSLFGRVRVEADRDDRPYGAGDHLFQPRRKLGLILV
jgi:hypothetical protein